jgi:hypothetical protein
MKMCYNNRAGGNAGNNLIAGWSSLVARWAHNPKVTGSNPVPALQSVNGPGTLERFSPPKF